jgi:hypothetical protein
MMRAGSRRLHMVACAPKSYQDAELKTIKLLVPLHAFNTEYTAPLADHSTLQMRTFSKG